jgi:hypothetical protein
MRSEASRLLVPLVLLTAGIVASTPAAAPPRADSAAADAWPANAKPLEVDHLMIHVSPGAKERRALVRAGFRIAPGVNEHEGQGSASITVELQNGFLELAWRDTSVRVAPGLEMVATRFERMGKWRTSGWSPFGIGLRRAVGAPDSLPFPTRVVRGPWMRPGAALEIISAANDTTGPRLWVVSRSMAANGVPESESERDRLSKRETFVHANGARAITAVKVTLPDSAFTPGVEVAAANGPVEFVRGAHWLLEVTFDGGRQRATKDLRPELPLVCHF